MRRIAWKQWRSCSSASRSMWADSLARNREAGWIRLARRSSRPSPGAAPATRSPGRDGALRSSSAMARSRRAWPSPIGDDRYSARFGRHSARVQRCAAAERGRPPAVDEVPEQPVDDTGSRPDMW